MCIRDRGGSGDGWLATIQLSLSSGSYPTDNPSIFPISSFSSSGINSWNNFQEQATKNGGEIYYQLSVNGGLSWLYWNGWSWVNTGSSNFNAASTIASNINRLSTSSQMITFKAFLNSDGTQQVILSEVSIGYSSNSSGYKNSGFFVSSAFSLVDNSPVQVISWDENIPDCTPACEIKMQVRTAPDASGLPGTWTDWYGSGGANTYFTYHYGELISKNLNWNRWVQYRAELTGDGNNSPVLNEVRINYK
jgi:hypothetical protein